MSNRDTIITALKKATVAIVDELVDGAWGELGGCGVIVGNA